MAPYEFVQKYHKLLVQDSRLGLHCTLDITRYISGMPDENRKEYAKILS